MRAEAGAFRAGRMARLLGRAWLDLGRVVSRLPQRLRERRFWYVQALIFVATAPHYVIEVTGFTTPLEIYGLAIVFYTVPLVYAAVVYGWEGAILTSAWAAALTSPSLWIWHRSTYHWFVELGQLMVTLPVGLLVAWRVERETTQRMRAERTSASLRLLNEIGEKIGHTLEVERELPWVLHRLMSGLQADSTWLCLESDSPEGDLVVMSAPAGSAQCPLVFSARELHTRVASTRESVNDDGRVAVVPLVTEAGILGSLGVAVDGGRTITGEGQELLTTAALQISTALENARLYRERQESLRSYVRQVTHVQEEERLRIARDLHDETAQDLVSLVRKIEQLGNNAGSEFSGEVADLVARARSTLQSVRRFSRNLRPAALDDLGLLAAIEMVVNEAGGHLAQGSRLKVAGEPRRLDSSVELALFRIAQEALRNVQKHAGAASALVEITFGKEDVSLSISDDGPGFRVPRNVSDLPRAGKLGLLGMRERAELIGGAFEVQSAPGRGTRVTVRVRADGASLD